MGRPEHTPLAGRRARELRTRMTVSEAGVWRSIKNGRAGARFRRQVPIGPWIVDFCSLGPKLVVEIDDTSHEWRDETDRTAYIKAQGFAILRFTNEEVAKELPSVFNTIEAWVEVMERTGRPPD